MRISVQDLRNIELLKYYRIVRKATAKKHGLTEAELELLIYLDCVQYFDIPEFKKGTYAYSWNKGRWGKLRREGFIDVFKNRDRKASKSNTYTVSFKTKRLITRIYKVLLGEEELATSRNNPYYKNKTYTDKVYNRAIEYMLKDRK